MPVGLAQRGDLFVSIAPWLGLLVVLILVGGTVALWLKRRYLQQTGASDAGFTLSDLRELAQSGQITQEEFENARTQMIARVRGAAEDAVPDHEGSSDGETHAGGRDSSRDLDGMNQDSIE